MNLNDTVLNSYDAEGRLKTKTLFGEIDIDENINDLNVASFSSENKLQVIN